MVKSVHRLHETPRERLIRTGRYSLPRKPEVVGPTPSLAVVLLVVILAVLAVVILGGWVATDVFRLYTDRITEIAS